MKICMINGSPKAGKSTSELLIGYLLLFLKGNEIITYHMREIVFSQTQFSQIQSSDVLIFAFPLYVDSINSALLRVLAAFQDKGFGNKNLMVYCICSSSVCEGSFDQRKGICGSGQDYRDGQSGDHAEVHPAQDQKSVV